MLDQPKGSWQTKYQLKENGNRSGCLCMYIVSPVVLFNVIDELGLDVGLSWNGDGLLHEGFVEVHFVHLHLQLRGDLEQW